MKPSSKFILWLAQGFGVGRIPLAPGTFGSLVGLGWLALLLPLQSPVLFCLGIILSVPLSVWLAGTGEKILNQTDPGSIVIDEIIAIPISFVGWLFFVKTQKGFWPGIDYLFSPQNIWSTVGIFLLFRFFDVLKPWPVGKSQRLPGGWGVTMDDVLAAVYVNIVVLIVLLVRS